MGGIQMITIGILGEYLARLNENVRKWPIAVIAETTSVDTPR
jgi:dolichol-phosphate mannosyltransferase